MSSRSLIGWAGDEEEACEIGRVETFYTDAGIKFNRAERETPVFCTTMCDRNLMQNFLHCNCHGNVCVTLKMMLPPTLHQIFTPANDDGPEPRVPVTGSGTVPHSKTKNTEPRGQGYRILFACVFLPINSLLIVMPDRLCCVVAIISFGNAHTSHVVSTSPPSNRPAPRITHHVGVGR